MAGPDERKDWSPYDRPVPRYSGDLPTAPRAFGAIVICIAIVLGVIAAIVVQVFQ